MAPFFLWWSFQGFYVYTYSSQRFPVKAQVTQVFNQWSLGLCCWKWKWAAFWDSFTHSLRQVEGPVFSSSESGQGFAVVGYACLQTLMLCPCLHIPSNYEEQVVSWGYDRPSISADYRHRSSLVRCANRMGCQNIISTLEDVDLPKVLESASSKQDIMAN